jgi:hypothetical protein
VEGTGGEGEDGFADGAVEDGGSIDAGEFRGFVAGPGRIDGEDADNFKRAMVRGRVSFFSWSEFHPQGDMPFPGGLIDGKAGLACRDLDFSRRDGGGMTVDLDGAEAMASKLQW